MVQWANYLATVNTQQATSYLDASTHVSPLPYPNSYHDRHS